MIHLGDHLHPGHGSLLLHPGDMGELRNEAADDEGGQAFRHQSFLVATEIGDQEVVHEFRRQKGRDSHA
jgi:hypothetical protein